MYKILAKTYNFENQKKFFWVLAAAVGILILTYGYLVKSTVFNVSQWEKNDRELSSLRGRVGELELAYFAAKEKINTEMAETLGFSEILTPKFVSRVQPQKTVSLGRDLEETP